MMFSMKVKKDREFRVQFMLPGALNEELKRLPLIFLPLATLEWHGPHMVVGVDPLNAERSALPLESVVADALGTSLTKVAI